MEDRVKQIADIPETWFEREVDWALRSLTHFLYRKHNMADALEILGLCLVIVALIMRWGAFGP